MDQDIEVHVPYERFLALCEAASGRYGLILSLPIGPDPRQYLKTLYQSAHPGGRVLDFGCGARKPLQGVLGLRDDRYHACDSDPSGCFTYRSVHDIGSDMVYEIVAADQVFEHLSFGEGLRTAIALGRHVAPGGILEISVPNPQHPTRFLSHPLHVTPWNYLNLCALLEVAGLEVILCARTNKYPSPKWWERPLVDFMCRIFRMDWCDTVYAVGRRTARTVEPTAR